MSFDKHHITPTEIVLVPHKQHQKIHNNVPINTEINLKMRQYDKLVQLSIMLKNWKTSYEKEFGCNPIDIGLEQILNKKKELLKDAKVLIKDDLRKVKHIKGLGTRYLAGLLAYAHPKRFRNLHRFLLYCGYKGNNLKYSRKVKSIIHQVVINLIMHKDKHYYALYLKIKNDLNKKFPKYRNGRIDGMARNRVGTFLLKEVYTLFRDG